MSAARARGAPGQRPPKKEPSFGKRKAPLKKSRKRRPMAPEQMDELVADVMLRDGRCVAIDHDDAMCDGPTDAHHIVPQRVLKAHFKPGHGIFRDKRNAVALCRTHHDLVERRFLWLPEEVLPVGFPAFLNEFGFAAWWEGENMRRAA